MQRGIEQLIAQCMIHFPLNIHNHPQRGLVVKNYAASGRLKGFG